MVKRVIVVLMLLAVFVGSTAANQDEPQTPRSVTKARKLSLYGTLIPVVTGAAIYFGASDRFENWDDGESIVAVSIAGAGIIFGPALGHCYAGEWRYLGKAIWLRLTIAGFAAGAAAWSSAWNGNVEGQGFIAPSILIIFSAVWDIAKVRNSVEKYNNGLNQRSLSLRPCYYADDDAFGIQLSLTF